jgi:predicted Ser/Thr protein kinase
MGDFDRVIAIFHAARERPAADRGALLDEQCGSDHVLRAEVESLLAADQQAGGFLERPAAVAAGLAEAASPPLLEGARLGPYIVERELGHGGMGMVYLAEDARLGRKVAIKVLAPGFTRDERRRERMRLEARAAAALSHPGIATVYELEEFGEHLCLVCEYVRGETLRAEIDRGPLPPDPVIDTGVQLAEALQAAHAAGVVHRDLKPENVMRDDGGRVRILDFGVARLHPDASLPPQRMTEAGILVGTPAYMSPEQLDGSDVDARSDIFALGVLLFELASGVHPFETKTPASTAARVLAAHPPSLLEINQGIPAGLDTVIRRCLVKDPADRYQSASDVARDLGVLRRGGRAAEASGVVSLGMSTSSVAGASTGPAVRGRVTRRPTPAGWWVLHQATVIAVAALIVWPVALVHQAAKSDWTVAILLAVIAVAAVNGTLRAHLLFTHHFNEVELSGQLKRTELWLRRSDGLFAALLLAAVVATARSHVVRSAILAAVAVGWIVTALVIEPATRRAAFPDRSSDDRRA